MDAKFLQFTDNKFYSSTKFNKFELSRIEVRA